jgi:hypothetical protein
VSLLQAAAETAEKGQHQEARSVKGPHLPRLGGDPWLLKGLDRHLERLDFALHRVGHGGRPAPDQSVRLQIEHVANDRAGELFQQGGHAGAYSLDGGHGRIERKQNLGPHDRYIA